MKNCITVKEISGLTIPTIPVGTVFTIDRVGPDFPGYTHCKYLPITTVWNDEFEIIKEKEQTHCSEIRNRNLKKG